MDAQVNVKDAYEALMFKGVQTSGRILFGLGTFLLRLDFLIGYCLTILSSPWIIYVVVVFVAQDFACFVIKQRNLSLILCVIVLSFKLFGRRFVFLLMIILFGILIIP